MPQRIGFWKTQLSLPRESITCLCRLSWRLWFTPEGKKSPLHKCTFLNTSGVAWFTAGLCQGSHKMSWPLRLSGAGSVAGPAETQMCRGWAVRSGSLLVSPLPWVQTDIRKTCEGQESVFLQGFGGEKRGRRDSFVEIPNSLQTCKVSESCFAFILTCEEGWS